MNRDNVGQNTVDQEIRASKGTAGGDFGLIFAAWARRAISPFFEVQKETRKKLVTPVKNARHACKTTATQREEARHPFSFFLLLTMTTSGTPLPFDRCKR